MPGGGVHVGSEVAKGAGEGRPLFHTTGEDGEEVTEGGNDLDTVVLEKISDKLNKAMGRAAVETEGGTLHF